MIRGHPVGKWILTMRDRVIAICGTKISRLCMISDMLTQVNFILCLEGLEGTVVVNGF